MDVREKVVAWADLVRRVESWREAGQKVVHCHGVFDLLHIGHIRYLQRASELGDVLAVTVTPDSFVNKGPHRPAFLQQHRLEAVAALDCVDAVACNRWPTACEAIRALRPAVYAKGAEFRHHKTPELLAEETAAVAAGTQVEFIDELTSSSTELINRYLSSFSERAEAYLSQFRSRHATSDVLGFLTHPRDLRICVIGETIIDEFYYCSSVGQSTKAPIVATRYESHQRYAGGAVAVANHLAAFVNHVELVTMVGDQDDEEDWIRQRLRDNIQVKILRKRESPTIVKRRYRDAYFEAPLFAISFLNDDPLASDQVGWLQTQLGQQISGSDAVVVADYGHGMLKRECVELLCRDTPFLAVTTQANAGNFGRHTISKYPRADFFSLAQRELELECRDHEHDHEAMLRSVIERLGSARGVVTFGQRGCLVLEESGSCHAAPSLATRVVDRIGAGDAFFAISTLCAAQDAPPDVLAFLGNLAGADSVAMVGNAERRASESLIRSIESWLK